MGPYEEIPSLTWNPMRIFTFSRNFENLIFSHFQEILKTFDIFAFSRNFENFHQGETWCGWEGRWVGGGGNKYIISPILRMWR